MSKGRVYSGMAEWDTTELGKQVVISLCTMISLPFASIKIDNPINMQTFLRSGEDFIEVDEIRKL